MQKLWNYLQSLWSSPFPKGRHKSVSYFRRLVIDMMRFSAKIPCVTVERRMNLAPLIAARAACKRSPSWSALFMKAFALVAAKHPQLRTAYLTFPWSRFYEHPGNVAALTIDRQLEKERIVLFAYLADPEKRTLPEIDAVIDEYKQLPVEQIPSYRVSVRLSRTPWPFRQMAWNWGLNMYGASRSHYFGTYAISTVGCHGAGITTLVPLLTSTIHYGMFEPSGALAMRLSFDHRVLDASTAAIALNEMEAALLKEILQECQSLEQASLRLAA